MWEMPRIWFSSLLRCSSTGDTSRIERNLRGASVGWAYSSGSGVLGGDMSSKSNEEGDMAVGLSW